MTATMKQIISFAVAAGLIAASAVACDNKKAPATTNEAKPATETASTTAGAAAKPSAGENAAKPVDATCEEAAKAIVPPNAKDDPKAAKIEAAVLESCKELPWSAAERSCFATSAGNVERCEGEIGQPRMEAIFTALQDKMRGPAVPAPADVAAPPKDAKKTAKGVFYKVLTKGTGKTKPTAASSVTVHYTGWTTDGKMFDSSVAGGEPATFPLGGVIAGWTDGLQVMVEGEKTRFWIPVELAYNNQPGRPAGMLVFDVELIKIAN